MSFFGEETRTCTNCHRSVTFGCIPPGGWRTHDVIEGFKGLNPQVVRYELCSDRCDKLFLAKRALGGAS